MATLARLGKSVNTFSEIMYNYLTAFSAFSEKIWDWADDLCNFYPSYGMGDEYLDEYSSRGGGYGAPLSGILPTGGGVLRVTFPESDSCGAEENMLPCWKDK